MNEFDTNDNPLKALAYATKYARNAEILEGRRVFPTLAIVVDNNDPEYRRRVKVADPSFGGKVQSNWIMPIRVTENNDPPLPKLNQSVMVLFADGDPEKGYYLTLMPDTNPGRDKEDSINDHAEKIEGNRSLIIDENESKTVEGNKDVVVGNQYKVAVGGDADLYTENDFTNRANQNIDISCGESLILRTDSGAFIQLTSTGFAVIQDAFGRKITLGGIGNNGQWDLNGFPLQIIQAADVTINGKSVVVVGGKDDRNDTIVYKGY
jgi:hypothetical protein